MDSATFSFVSEIFTSSVLCGLALGLVLAFHRGRG